MTKKELQELLRSSTEDEDDYGQENPAIRHLHIFAEVLLAVKPYLNVLKSSWAVSHVNVVLKTNV
jgi:hypothetical protein